MGPNDADGMANSVDPDQTAPLGAVWSGSALFAKAYLSENLGSLVITIHQTKKNKMPVSFIFMVNYKAILAIQILTST